MCYNATIHNCILYYIGGYGSLFDTFLVESLRDRYIETRYIPEGKEWPPNQPKYYVNLAVIHYQGSQTQGEVIFRSRHYQHIDNEIDKTSSLLCASSQRSKFSNKFLITREIVDLFKTDPCIGETESDANFGHLQFQRVS